jgi:Skp family chaperone for outer membrane proteins
MQQLCRWVTTAACLAALVGSGYAWSQTARTGGNANAQVLQQMQQLASERTTLQAENDKLKSQLANVTKDRDALKAAQQALNRRAADATAALAHDAAQRQAADQETTQLKAKMQELIAKFRETIQKLRETEGDDATTKQSLAARERELSVCVDHNVALYHLDDEVLTHLEKQTVWSRVAEAEPFTKIKRIELQNFADEYRTKAGEQLLPSSPNASSQQGAPPSAPGPTAGSTPAPTGAESPEH